MSCPIPWGLLLLVRTGNVMFYTYTLRMCPNTATLGFQDFVFKTQAVYTTTTLACVTVYALQPSSWHGMFARCRRLQVRRSKALEQRWRQGGVYRFFFQG